MHDRPCLPQPIRTPAFSWGSSDVGCLRRVKTTALVALLSLPLAACAAGPDYRPPATAALGLPDGYSGPTPAPGEPDDLGSWWNRFDDPVLERLVERALTANLNIAQAVARLRQSRELLVQAGASRLPTVDGSAGAGRFFTNQAADSTSLSLGADAAYEVDLFGRVSRSIEAARADADAAGFSAQTTRVSIAAETASAYIQARAAEARLTVARETLAIQDDNLQIAGWRAQAGLVSSLDEEQARTQRAQTAASIPTLESSYAIAVNRLAVLTGAPPGTIAADLGSAPIPAGPDDIAVGIPADTLRQRPDVRAAERALAAATARIGVAASQLYPSLRLSGTIGTSAGTIGALGDVLTGGLSASIAQLIFDGGRVRSQVRGQRAAADGALAAYRQSVLTALEDVENGLVALDSAKRRQAELTIAFDAANNAAILARSQYRAGLTDFRTLLDAERSLLSARDGLTAARADQSLAVVQLYRALGGGWQAADLSFTDAAS